MNRGCNRFRDLTRIVACAHHETSHVHWRLRVGYEDCGPWRLLQLGLSRIRNHAHDLRRIRQRPTNIDPLSDRFLAGKELLRECLVYHDCTRRAEAVSRTELAAAHNGSSH